MRTTDARHTGTPESRAAAAYSLSNRAPALSAQRTHVRAARSPWRATLKRAGMWLVCGRIARASLGGVDFPAPGMGGGGDALSGTYARRVCGQEPWFVSRRMLRLVPVSIYSYSVPLRCLSRRVRYSCSRRRMSAVSLHSRLRYLPPYPYPILTPPRMHPQLVPSVLSVPAALISQGETARRGIACLELYSGAAHAICADLSFQDEYAASIVVVCSRVKSHEHCLERVWLGVAIV